MASIDRTFPLVPRWRVLGVAFGSMSSMRRGGGYDVVGSRAYMPGDPVDRIDWHASARLSSARDADEFVVREHEAEEAPRVVIAVDRRPSMMLYGSPVFPWLDKRQAVSVACELIAASTARARGLLGFLDHGEGEADPFWRAPRGLAEPELVAERLRDAPFHAPPGSLELALEHLALSRSDVPAGTFVFLVSDFLERPPYEAWELAAEHRWDVVPVVVQDPVWEQSFPELPAIVVPVTTPAGERSGPVRLSRRTCARLRREHEARLADVLEGLEGSGLDPILLGTADPDLVHEAFLAWSVARTPFAQVR